MSNQREAKIQLTGDASGLAAASTTGAAALDKVGAAADRAQDALSSTTAAAAAYNAASRTVVQGATAQSAALAAQAKASEDAGRRVVQGANAQAAGVAAQSNAVQRSARQNAQAMAMLPVQLGDVASQLSTGANPFVVLLQQGLQVKDSFGGLGPMFKGIAAAITPTVAVVGGLGTAFAVASLAAIRGYAETQAYTRAIEMTGNAAGVTRGQLNEMAKATSSSAGSQAQAAAVLAQATATGQIAKSNLEAVTDAALRMERNLGASVEGTIKTFAELGRKPAEASAALNQQYNYLNAATFKRIQMLEQQKRTEEAAALAQQAFAEAMSERNKNIEAQLGSLERGWRKVGEWASKAWSSMLGLGREQTLQEQLGSVSAQLDALANRRSQNPLQTQQRREAIVQRQAELQELERLQRRGAEIQAAQAETNQKQIAKLQDDAKRSEGLTKARYAAEIAAIEQAGKAKADAIAQQIRVVESAQAAGLISEAQAYAERRRLTEAETTAQITSLEAQNRALLAQKLKQEEAIARDATVAKNREEIIRIWQQGAASLTVLQNQEAARLRNLANATQQYREELDALLQSRARQNQRELEGAGMGDAARERAGRRATIDDRYEQDLRKLNAERAGGKLPEDEYQTRLAALQRYYGEATNMEAQYQAQREALQGRGDLGFQRAWENYRDRAKDIYTQVQDVAGRAFQSIEDYVVNSAMGAKTSFSDMAKSIIADILRIYVRKQMLNMMEGIFGKGGGGGWGSASDMLGRAWRSFTGTGNMSESFTGASTFHGGGRVGYDKPYAYTYQPPELWNGAPRLHAGLANDEYRAILKRDESVLTPGQMSQLAPVGAGARPQSIDIRLINESGQPLQAESARQRQDGGFDVVLRAAEEFMADRVSAGTGALTSAMRGRFGLRDSLT